MRSVVRAYAAMKPIRTPTSRQSRPRPGVLAFLFSPRAIVAAVVVALVGSSGGIAYAAGSSLPGDILYPVKRHVTEPIAQAVAVSPAARAETATKLANRRIDEAAELSRQGRLSEATRDELTRDFETHIEQAFEAAAQAPIAAAVTAAVAATTTLTALERDLGDREEELERLSASTTDLAPIIAAVKQKKASLHDRRARSEDERVPTISATTSAVATTSIGMATSSNETTGTVRSERERAAAERRTIQKRTEEVRRAKAPQSTSRATTTPPALMATTTATTTVATSTEASEGIIESTIHAGERASNYIGESVRNYVKRWRDYKQGDKQTDKADTREQVEKQNNNGARDGGDEKKPGGRSED